MAAYRFQRGYYYMAGVDKPFYASVDMIIDGVEDMGFKVLLIGECEKWGDQGRMPFNTQGNVCGDQYDWVGMAERTGPDEVIDLPSQVKWLQGWPGPSLVPPAPAPGQPSVPAQPPPAPAPTYVAPTATTPGTEPSPAPQPGGEPQPAAVAPAGVDWRVPAAVAGGFGGLMLARWWHLRRRR